MMIKEIVGAGQYLMNINYPVIIKAHHGHCVFR